MANPNPNLTPAPGVELADVVHRHQFDRLAAHQPNALELASIEQHLQKSNVIGCRGDQTSPAGIIGARPPVGIADRVVQVTVVNRPFDNLANAAFVARRVDRGQAPGFMIIEIEMGVGHFKRLKYPRVEELGQRHPRNNLHEVPEHIDGQSIGVFGARLEQQRQLTKLVAQVGDGSGRFRESIGDTGIAIE